MAGWRAIGGSIAILVLFTTCAGGQAPSSTVLYSSAIHNGAAQSGGPGGKTLRLAVTRDTWFSAVGHEADGNLGGAGQLKLKSIQEMSIVDIDPGALKGHVIRRATLHVRKRGDELLHRVTISSFSSDWVEGTSTNYEPQAGSSCFNFKRYPDVPWAYAGSDLTAVTLGQGGSVWAMAEATQPDSDGWMQIAVDPAIVAARVAGISQGFLLFDDTGSEWARSGEQFKIRHFPNRYIFSKDNGRQNAPYFTIELGEEDHQPPSAPEQLQSSINDLPAGEADVSWLTPKDAGPAGTIGFVVEVNGKPVPRYLVPAAGIVAVPVTMHLRDLGLKPGETAQVVVRAVDGAGNASEPAKIDVTVSAQAVGVLPGEDPKPFTDGGALPRIGGAEVAMIDALDKVQPVTGNMIPPQEPGYLSANHLWSASRKTLRLDAARNEFTSFQILLRGPMKDLSAKLELGGQPGFDVGFYRYANVASKAGLVPDPLLPFEGRLTTPSGDSNASLMCEVYVPHDAVKGKHNGTLVLRSGGEELKIAVELTVWDFTLPDYLSFIPEMNCYGLPADEADYYRLAHRNRTVINRVPYYQNGVIADGCAPAWDGKSLDWAAWDARFGPYLDGSAFSDMPRKGVPLEIFYLPIFENWPSPMEGNYNGSYWADEAFPPAYRQNFVECSRQFAAHFNAKKWDGTLFQCFFNGKTDFKERGWSHESSPWLLDEPANFQDFWALRWFGQAFHEGTAAAQGSAKMLFRCDISRPQWQRDALDAVLNYNVVAGGPFHQYHRLVMDRKRQFGQVVITYGSSNDPADSNMQPVGWCLDSWTLGADGVLPWQVIGSDESWKKAEDTCLFYPGGPAGQKGPVASIRLKAYLRGEQDVEYLALLARLQKHSQLELGRTVRAAMNLKGERKATGFVGGEDAGVIDFSGLRPQDAWRLRERIGAVLSEAHPEPVRRLN
jgi:hypothetical protein